MSDFPAINAGEIGSTRTFTQVFLDTFDEDGPGPGPNFVYDTLDDALNRTGNGDMDENGNSTPGRSVEGKRWSAYTNGPNDEFVFRRDGILHVGGKSEFKTDPTRENYTHNGIAYNWRDRTNYAPYMVQMLRKYDNDLGRHVIDFDNSPGIGMSPGHFVEMRLSVEQVRTPGYRVSLWLTPDPPNESLMYDDDPANGVELDIFEIENWLDNGYGSNRIQCKCLGGLAGNTRPQGGGNIDLDDHGIDITQGFFTVGCMWLSTGIYWYVNGKEVIREELLIPQVDMTLSLTRELNSGVKDNVNSSDDIPSNGILRPNDVGLFGVSAFPHLDGMNQDVTLVDYLKVWSVDGENGTFRGANSQGESGTAVSGPSAGDSSSSTAVDTTQGIRFSQGLVAGEHRYELKDPSLTDRGTFDHSSYGADATVISGERGPTLRLQVDPVSQATRRNVTFELDDVDTLPSVIITFENVDPAGNYEAS